MVIRGMSTTETKIYKAIVRWALFASLAVGLLARCASQAAPRGGPRDTLPPKVVAMTPAFGTTNFKDKRIYIEFDEYVQLKDQQKEFYTSPFMVKKPSVALRGRGIQIDLKEDLDSNRTYALNFGQSVADNNEGNPYTGLRYVFSTGDHIDSMLMSGYTVDAQRGDTVGNVFILFYEAASDSVAKYLTPEYDSVVYKLRPYSVGRSFPNGIFIAENLRPIDYRIYALEDNNGNQTYEPGADRIAFLDSTCNPLTQPGFEMWYDTTRRYMQADPQVQMRMFKEEAARRQTLTGSSRPLGNKVLLTFSSPHPQIEELSFEGIDSTAVVTEYMASKRDSMVLWFKADVDELPDTLKGRLIYRKHDSVGVLRPDTQQLRLAWRSAVKKDKKKDEDEDAAPEPNPFQVKVAGGKSINPEKNIVFEFAYPLVRVDSASIRLEHIEGEDKAVPVDVTFRQDTLAIRKWTLRAPWVADEKYRLTIPAGAFENTSGQSNDTLRSEFTIESPDKFATLVLNVQGETPESEYIVQVVSPEGRLIKEQAHVRTGTTTLRYVDVGTVKIRIIRDDNRNGRWDTGSLLERRQPERVEFFVDDAGSEEIVTKENWELVFDVDMQRIFAPVTMEKMMEKIERDDLIRLREIAKKRAENAKNKGEHHHSSGMSGMSGMGGMGAIGGMMR